MVTRKRKRASYFLFFGKQRKIETKAWTNHGCMVEEPGQGNNFFLFFLTTKIEVKSDPFLM